MTASAEHPLLDLSGIHKRFGSVTALDNVQLTVSSGEVVGLLGENGAGKSTLMNILYGLTRSDQGHILVAGQEVQIRSPYAARALGIGMVHQHFTLVPDLTVLENLALSDGGRSWFWIDRPGVRRRLAPLLAELSWQVDLDARVTDLSIGDRQRVEILKALSAPDIRVLILDEPTASLTPSEVEELFAIVRRMRASGRAVILISHKLHEVSTVTDRVVVLRAGRNAAERVTKATTPSELGALMVGETSATGRTTAQSAVVPGAARLQARDVDVAGRHGRLVVHGANLAVRAGEIVGIAGVDGNGQGELLEALFGLIPLRRGVIEVDGDIIERPNPRALRDRGVAYIPADRHRTGLVPELSIEEGLVLGHHRRSEFGRGPLLNRVDLRNWAIQRIAAFGIRPTAPDTVAENLSGGNQQRLVLAREVAFAPKVILAESPTRGLDLAATATIHAELRSAKARGAAVLLASTDLEEVLELADHVLVMFAGTLHAASSRNRVAIGRLMGGVTETATEHTA